MKDDSKFEKKFTENSSPFKLSNKHGYELFIDNYGIISTEEKSTYKVELSGSYFWSFVSNCWVYEIKKIEPKIPLKIILSTKFLFETSQNKIN